MNTSMLSITGGIILLAASAALTACSSSSAKTEAKEDTAIAVATYQPTLTGKGELTVSGQVSSQQTAMISTRYMGFVERVLVKQGDMVRAGQLLVVVNSSDLQARYAQTEAMVSEAQAALAVAERDAQRFRNLHGQKSVSDKEVENVELHLASMRAKVQQARQGQREVKAMMAYTRITAPFSGVVTQKMVDAGSMANPGHPLLVIEQTGELQVAASVPEEYLKHVKVGDAVRVDIKATGRAMSGVVSELSPSATMTGGQYAIKVRLNGDKSDLRSGMYASVRVANTMAQSQTPRLLVDVSSVVRRDQLTGLYVVASDTTAQLRWVRLGKTVGSQVEVLSGLKAGEHIIRPSAQKLRNGQKVKLQS